MSIAIHINQLEFDGKLRRYTARSHRPHKRRLYLTRTAMRDVDGQSAFNLLVGKGFAEAAFTRWVLGDRIYGSGRKARFLKHLDPPPPDVWEIRITEPNPQGRIFTMFAAPDTLIVAGANTRPYLGDKGSQAWNAAMTSCAAQWAELFPTFAAFRAPDIHGYVTENCDDFRV